MIQVRDLTKRYGPTRALAHVSVDFRAGRVTAVAGPNGSGKTTLMKVLLGMVKADSGQVLLGGQSLNGHHDYRRQIGYMSQDASFPENLRASEVISLVRSLRSPTTTVDQRLLTRLALGTELDKRIRTLSGGTRQRLGAALAFMFQPELLILDEPTAGLDPVSCRILKDEILHYRELGKTVIVSSHIVGDIEELADDVVFLCDGHILFSGSKHDLKARAGSEQLDRCFIRLMQETAP